MNRKLSIAVLIAILTCFPGSVAGQAGVSSMSSSALRSGVALKHNEIRVQELVNFHRHQIALPGWEQRVGFETRAAKMVDGKTAFMLGFATHRDVIKEFRMPLNLVLVIDRSGSMSGDRIRKVKDSLCKLAGKLTSRDLVSIVTYSDEADICLEPTLGDDVDAVSSAIRNVEASGSTNLSAGLIKGYEVAMLNCESERANRVILLTDGLANRGVTDEAEIARRSKEYNDKGIGLSTIGLGNSFNRSLLRELADAGRGAIHFVADASDIKKVFVDEFDSLLSPAATDVSLKIRVSSENQRPKIFGYKVKQTSRGCEIEMENMSYGATQIVIGKFGANVPESVEVELRYFDSITKKMVVDVRAVALTELEKTDRVLQKNYCIAKLANAIKRSAKLAEGGSSEKANKCLVRAITFVRNCFESSDDNDVDRVCQIAIQQREHVRSKNRYGVGEN